MFKVGLIMIVVGLAMFALPIIVGLGEQSRVVMLVGGIAIIVGMMLAAFGSKHGDY